MMLSTAGICPIGIALLLSVIFCRVAALSSHRSEWSGAWEDTYCRDSARTDCDLVSVKRYEVPLPDISWAVASASCQIQEYHLPMFPTRHYLGEFLNSSRTDGWFWTGIGACTVADGSAAAVEAGNPVFYRTDGDTIDPEVGSDLILNSTNFVDLFPGYWDIPRNFLEHVLDAKPYREIPMRKGESSDITGNLVCADGLDYALACRTFDPWVAGVRMTLGLANCTLFLNGVIPAGSDPDPDAFLSVHCMSDSWGSINDPTFLSITILTSVATFISIVGDVVLFVLLIVRCSQVGCCPAMRMCCRGCCDYGLLVVGGWLLFPCCWRRVGICCCCVGSDVGEEETTTDSEAEKKKRSHCCLGLGNPKVSSGLPLPINWFMFVLLCLQAVTTYFIVAFARDLYNSMFLRSALLMAVEIASLCFKLFGGIATGCARETGDSGDLTEVVLSRNPIATINQVVSSFEDAIVLLVILAGTFVPILSGNTSVYLPFFLVVAQFGNNLLETTLSVLEWAEGDDEARKEEQEGPTEEVDRYPCRCGFQCQKKMDTVLACPCSVVATVVITIGLGFLVVPMIVFHGLLLSDKFDPSWMDLTEVFVVIVAAALQLLTLFVFDLFGVARPVFCRCGEKWTIANTSCCLGIAHRIIEWGAASVALMFLLFFSFFRKNAVVVLGSSLPSLAPVLMFPLGERFSYGATTLAMWAIMGILALALGVLVLGLLCVFRGGLKQEKAIVRKTSHLKELENLDPSVFTSSSDHSDDNPDQPDSSEDKKSEDQVLAPVKEESEDEKACDHSDECCSSPGGKSSDEERVDDSGSHPSWSGGDSSGDDLESI